MNVILDAFGGDYAPLEAVKGAVAAHAAYGYTVTLCGREAELRELCRRGGLSEEGLLFADAPDVISMEDEPRSILKAHKDCSMAVGLRMLAEGQGDAFVSAGSTGALLMGATFLVKRIAGISRPALGAVLPSDTHPFMLTDMGANADCRPEMLLQFAQMAQLYMTYVVKNGEPATVGLLNIGAEDTKGGELQHAAFALLRESGLPFVGNVEARDVPAGAADVIVADGFSGNVLLKAMEGTVQMLMKNIKQTFLATLGTKLAGLVIKPHLRPLKQKMDTSAYGGAVLLGVRKPVIKAHGNSDARAIQNAIRVAAECAAQDIPGRIAMLTAGAEEEA